MNHLTEENKSKRSDSLSPRQSFAIPGERRREQRVQQPISTKKPDSPDSPAQAEVADEVLMKWTVIRATERPLVSLLVLAALAGLVVLLYYIAQSWIVAAVLTSVVVLSLSQFLFPITYTLSTKGLRIQNVITSDFKTWQRLARFKVHPDAIQVAPAITGVRVRWNRGLLIFFGREDKARIEEIVRTQIADAHPSDHS